MEATMLWFSHFITSRSQVLQTLLDREVRKVKLGCFFSQARPQGKQRGMKGLSTIPRPSFEHLTYFFSGHCALPFKCWFPDGLGTALQQTVSNACWIMVCSGQAAWQRQPPTWPPSRVLWPAYSLPGKTKQPLSHHVLWKEALWSNAAADAAKSLHSCLTLCDPIDGSLPGSSVPGILQARTLEWVSISFSNACMHAKSLQSCPTLCDPIDGSLPGSSVPGILQARTGVGCHFLLQCMKVKSESEVTQSCPTLHDPMDCSPPGLRPWDFPGKSTGVGCHCLHWAELCMLHSMFSLAIYYTHGKAYTSTLTFQFIRSLLPLQCPRVLSYRCLTSPALQIVSSVPLFQIPHGWKTKLNRFMDRNRKDILKQS